MLASVVLGTAPPGPGGSALRPVRSQRMIREGSWEANAVARKVLNLISSSIWGYHLYFVGLQRTGSSVTVKLCHHLWGAVARAPLPHATPASCFQCAEKRRVTWRSSSHFSCLSKVLLSEGRCSGPGWPAGGSSAEAIPASGSAQELVLGGEGGWASSARFCSSWAFLGTPTLRWQQGWLHGHATHT